MTKNTKLLKQALKTLEGGKVRLCGDTLKDGSNYCAIGFLAAFAAKKEPAATDKALSKLGTFFEGGEYDENTNEYAPEVERRWTLPDVFAKDSTDRALEICAKVYGVKQSKLSEIVVLNDSHQKLSRVERLRVGIRALLDNKTAQKTHKELVKAIDN